jgi:3-oxoacyl-[acyl-carrier protein] reductase
MKTLPLIVFDVNETLLDLEKRTFLKQAGISRFGEPEDIAELMAFAISPASRFMTGMVLRMDGGEVKSN